MVNRFAAANKIVLHNYTLAKDTIIKLDSVRDKKLLRIKDKKPATKTAANLSDTTKKKAGTAAQPRNATTIPGVAPQDTTKQNPLSIKLQDTTKKKTVINGEPNELTETVVAKTADSTVVDNEHEISYFYGNARITYGELELDADFIRVDQKNHLIFASGRIDPKTHRYTGRPISKIGKNDKPITSDSLLVDYKTKGARTWNSATEQDGNFISGGQAKKLKNDEVAYENALLSTCDLPYPYTHFGIVITKGIAEKNRIISSLFYIEIQGVPLPIGLPFGFFPKPDSRSSGFILPSFGEDAKLGFYLRNFGYYFAINDYVDVTTQGTYYAKGSYELNSDIRYTKLYKYTGGLTLSYGSHNYGLEGDPAQKDFNIQWSHATSPSAHPGTTFSASVNAGTSSFYRNNPATTNYSLTQLTQNNLHSSIAYGHTWEGTPFNFTANIAHSQDLTRKTVTLELPSFSFNMSTISPFKGDGLSADKWYQKITVGYSLTGTNRLTNIPESELFKGSTFQKKLQNGFQHQIPIGMNLNVFKYFQLNGSINYTDRWYLQTTRKRFARGSLNGLDSMIVDTVPGFSRVGEYSLSAGVSTKVYGIISFKNSKIRKIRDVITPSIGFSYRPDYSSLALGYNQVAVSNATIPYPASVQRYSIYDQSIYGGPSGGRSAGLSFAIDNTIEAKVRAKSSDTSGLDRNVPILQGLSFSSFYNFAADSFKLAPIAFAAHTSILNQKISISFGGSLDPYVVNVKDSIANNQVIRYLRRENRYSWQDGKIPFLTNFNLSMGAQLNPAAFKPEVKKDPNRNQLLPNQLQNMNAAQANKLAQLNSDPNAYVDFNVPWNVALSYSFNYNNDRLSTVTSNTMQISGDVNVTPKWKVAFTTNYDLKTLRFSDATSFSIYRDLHCWDLSIGWIPFGYYKSYNVTLKVKATILQDLKLSKRKDYYNNL